MTITRKQVRREAIDEGVWPGVGYGDIDTSDEDSITATWLGTGGDSAMKWRNAYLLLDEAEEDADEIRRGERFEARDGRLMHYGPRWSAAPDTAKDFELHRYHPDKIHLALNRALQRRVFILQEDEIVTNGNLIYTLGTSPFDVFTGIPADEDPDQHILNVEEISGSGGTAIRKGWLDTSGRTMRGRLVDGVLSVEFSPAPSGNILVTWKKPFDPLTNDTATSEAPLRYAMWAMLFELYASFESQAIVGSESASQWNTAKRGVEVMMIQERGYALGTEYAHRIQRKRRPRRFTPAPRMGLRR